MKLLILLSTLILLSLVGVSQKPPQVLPNGVKVGKVKPGTSIITVDSVTQYSTGDIKFWKGPMQLSPNLPLGFKVGTISVPSTLTATEIGYNDGVTSNVQDQFSNVATQLGSKIDTTSTGNAYDYFYTKQQSQNLPYKSELLESFQRLGIIIKGVPAGGVSINSVMNGTSALTDGTCYFINFDVPDTVVWTGIKYVLNVAGNYTGDNYNGFALHTVTLAGVITKVVETVNDSELWKNTAYTIGTKAFPSPQTLLPGSYMISCHWNASATTTAPTVYTWGTITTNFPLLLLNGNKSAGYLTVQATTPASTTGSALTASSVMPFIFPY
jgi:hypothetical protein